jgi:hypothetical protein
MPQRRPRDLEAWRAHRQAVSDALAESIGYPPGTPVPDHVEIPPPLGDPAQYPVWLALVSITPERLFQARYAAYYERRSKIAFSPYTVTFTKRG